MNASVTPPEEILLDKSKRLSQEMGVSVADAINAISAVVNWTPTCTCFFCRLANRYHNNYFRRKSRRRARNGTSQY